MQVDSAQPEQRINDSSALPEQAKYGADAMLLKSSRVTSKFFPQNGGSFGPTSARIVRFVISSPHFLDLCQARLLCDFKNTSTTSGTDEGLVLDGGLGGCIRRLTVLNSSGQLLERIDDYNQLQAILQQCSPEARTSKESLMLTENIDLSDRLNAMPDHDEFGYTVAAVGGNAGASPPVFPTSYTATVNSRTYVPAAVTTPVKEMAMTIGTQRELSHKLHGGWFQTQKKKLLPPGVAFMLELEVVPNATEVYVRAGATGAMSEYSFTLSNLCINIPTVQIMSQSFEDSTARLLSRGWSWAGTTYRPYHHIDTSGTQTITVPDKSLALTGIIAVPRLVGDLNNDQKFQNLRRSSLRFVEDYNLQIGSQQYPSSRIKYIIDGDTFINNKSYSVANNVQEVKSVMGNIPIGPANLYGVEQGTGFLAVQCGYSNGIGIDTQTASLPVIFNCKLLEGTNAAPTDITLYCQSTATFRMMPSNGMMEVVSYI